MKRLLAILLLCTSAFATTTVTGNIKTLGVGNVTSGAFVRFWLRGCAGNQPRITGTGIIGPSQGGVFYFDLVANGSGAVSGTLFSTRDSLGTGNGDIECGGSYTAVWYGMQAFVAGKGGPEIPVHAKNGGTLDISNVTPITTNPVIVAPTGDSTYLRLDAGNSPVTGPTTFQSNISAGKINGTVYVDGATYAQTAAGVQAAVNAACNGTVLGKVVIPGVSFSMGTTGISIPNNCDIGGEGQASTKLSWTNTTATTFFSNASASPANIRIHDMTVDGGSGTNSNEGCIGMNAVTSPTDITMERLTCQNVGFVGINITGSTGNLGNRVKVLHSKVLSACLNTFSPGTQCYGILVSNNSHLLIQDNEVSGGNISAGVSAFSGTNASAATPVVDIQVLGNRIHDLTETITTGGGVDVGRARQVVIAGNNFYNIQNGGCAFLEAVWGGSMVGNECSVADTVLTGGPFVVKTPDTTQSGEVASQDISVIGNTLVDNSLAADTNGGITVNGAQRNITIANNSLSYMNQASNSPSAIFLQLGTNDANISASSQNFCNGITVTGNTITNRPGTGSATVLGIQLQQTASGCTDDQIVISNNVVLGTNIGIKYAGTSASNGITHTYIHDNSVDTPTTGLANDAKTYASVFTWNNNASGAVANIMPAQTFSRFKLADQGQCTMAAGTCSAQSLASTYSGAPSCYVSWTGTGTLTGILKVGSTTTTVTPSSSVGTDTAVVNWACLGN